ncbi:MAG: hypothetical protein L0226_16375 [Acidobacteria bacterium]|nr:hypothetical protein [Acidobacteriota bacterium]
MSEPSGETGSAITSIISRRRINLENSEQGLKNYTRLDSKSGDSPQMYYKVRTSAEKRIMRAPVYTRRYAIGQALATAEQEARDMEEFARAGEVMELSIAGFSLKRALQDLWDLRNDRENDWGDLLNLLQIVLAQVEFEQFTVDQCAAIRKIIVDHLGSGLIDIDDLESSVKLLRKVGFDPWVGISAR